MSTPDHRIKTIVADFEAHLARQVTPGRGQRRGVVIGIGPNKFEKFDAQGKPRLRLEHARRDAQVMHDLMVNPDCGLFPPGNVKLLLDEQATRENIIEALVQLRQESGPDDTVWIVFSGHKGWHDNEFYWITYDTNLDRLQSTGLTNAEVEKRVSQINAARLVLILDCCHALGSDAAGLRTKDTPVTPEEYLGQFTGKGRVTLAASGTGEKAIELDRLGHGAFIFHLKEGLEGAADADGDGVVTLPELWAYVIRNVKAEANRLNRTQTPWKQSVGDDDDRFALSLNLAQARRQRELAQAVADWEGVGPKQLDPAEAKFCLDLLKRRLVTPEEKAVAAQFEAAAAGRLELAIFKQLVQAALKAAAFGHERGRWKARVWQAALAVLIVAVSLSWAVVAYLQHQDARAREQARRDQAVLQEQIKESATQKRELRDLLTQAQQSQAQASSNQAALQTALSSQAESSAAKDQQIREIAAQNQEMRQLITNVLPKLTNTPPEDPRLKLLESRLAGVSGIVEKLTQQTNSPEDSDRLKELKAQVESLAAQLRERSRASNSPEVLALQATNAALVRQMGELVSRAAAQTNLSPSTPQVGQTRLLDLSAGVSMEFCGIPAGEFMLGSTKAERDWAAGPEGQGKAEWFTGEGEAPRLARIKQGFWMGRTEVTVGQWKRFVAESRPSYRTEAEKAGEAWCFDPAKNEWRLVKGKSWKDPNYGDPVRDEHPVACITWNDAQAFVAWLNKKFAGTDRLPAGMKYRLPTEAEWEYACRGARAGTKFWWGDSVAEGQGRLNASSDDKPGPNFGPWSPRFPWSDGYAWVSPVDVFGAKGRNGFGLADTLGGLWEWCEDGYDSAGAHEECWTKDTSLRVLRTTYEEDRATYICQMRLLEVS